MNKNQTVKEAIESSTAIFQEQKIDTPRLDAELILAHVLGIGRLNLYINPSRLLTEEEANAFRKLANRRIKREPTAYILGKKEFWSLEFKIDRRALIPRPETELLIKCVLDHAPKKDLTGLDMGTGSGVIPIVLSKELDSLHMTAIDFSEQALSLARENAQIHQAGGKIIFLQGNLFEPLKTMPQASFDFIVSNPPYIPKSDLPALQPEVRQYEPFAALNGGESGLVAIQQIVRDSPHYLKANGFLCMEIGAGQWEGVNEIIHQTRAFGEARILIDYAGIERVVLAKRHVL